MPKVLIHATREIIDKACHIRDSGTGDMSSDCLVALAAQQVIPQARVGVGCMWTTHRKGFVVLPIWVSGIIEAWVDGFCPEPFMFHVNVPDSWLKPPTSTKRKESEK